MVKGTWIFFIASTCDKNFERRWKHRKWAQLSLFEMRWNLDLENGSTAVLNISFAFWCEVCRDVRHKIGLYKRNHIYIYIFQGKWNILFKINATASFRAVSSSSYDRKRVREIFLNDLWRVYNRCMCRLYSLLLSIFNKNQRCVLLPAPVSSCHKQKRERNWEDQYSFKVIHAVIIYRGFARIDAITRIISMRGFVINRITKGSSCLRNFPKRTFSAIFQFYSHLLNASMIENIRIFEFENFENIKVRNVLLDIKRTLHFSTLMYLILLYC